MMRKRRRLEGDIRWVLRAQAERIEPPPDLVERLLAGVQTWEAGSNGKRHEAVGSSRVLDDSTEALVLVPPAGQSRNGSALPPRKRSRGANWLVGISAAAAAAVLVMVVTSTPYPATDDPVPIPLQFSAQETISVCPQELVPRTFDISKRHIVEFRSSSGVIQVQLTGDLHGAVSAVASLACHGDALYLTPMPFAPVIRVAGAAATATPSSPRSVGYRRGSVLVSSDGSELLFVLEDTEATADFTRIGEVVSGAKVLERILTENDPAVINRTRVIELDPLPDIDDPAPRTEPQRPSGRQYVMSTPTPQPPRPQPTIHAEVTNSGSGSARRGEVSGSSEVIIETPRPGTEAEAEATSEPAE